MCHGPTFFDEMFPTSSALGSAGEAADKRVDKSAELDEIVKTLYKKKNNRIVWDGELQRLLCSCIIQVGTDPAKIKQKCRIFEEAMDEQLISQIEKILQLKCA